DVEIRNGQEIRPIPHRRSLRNVLLAELLRAFVGGVGDCDDFGVGVPFQCRQMAIANDLPGSNNADPELVVTLLHHNEVTGIRVPELKKCVRLRGTARGLKTINKNGAYRALKKAGAI